jgi:hypothetical protein
LRTNSLYARLAQLRLPTGRPIHKAGRVKLDVARIPGTPDCGNMLSRDGWMAGARGSGLVNAAQNDGSLRKYQESLRILERDEKLLRAREQVLRWLVGRLCLAAQGQSTGWMPRSGA